MLNGGEVGIIFTIIFYFFYHFISIFSVRNGYDNFEHLKLSIEKPHGQLFYNIQYVDISMPNNVRKQLIKYRHSAPKRPQHCPFKPALIKYGRSAQETKEPEESPPLSADGKKIV